MIRMGRSNKSEPQQPTETPQFKESYAGTSGAVYSRQETQPTTTVSRTAGGAMSESESIGRDIKEGRLSGFVGYGTVLTGETTFQSMLRVDGHLTGRVTSENGTLIVGSSGRVDANVMVSSASVNGTINGDIIALEKVELGRTARVMGNIQTPRITIEDGAIFEGSISMLKAQELVEQRAAEARAQKQAATMTAAESTQVEAPASEYATDDKTYSEAAVS